MGTVASEKSSLSAGPLTTGSLVPTFPCCCEPALTITTARAPRREYPRRWDFDVNGGGDLLGTGRPRVWGTAMASCCNTPLLPLPLRPQQSRPPLRECPLWSNQFWLLLGNKIPRHGLLMARRRACHRGALTATEMSSVRLVIVIYGLSCTATTRLNAPPAISSTAWENLLCSRVLTLPRLLVIIGGLSRTTRTTTRLDARSCPYCGNLRPGRILGLNTPRPPRLCPG
jgi:hypothetical protein